MPPSPSAPRRTLLGRGRSGVVWAERDAQGREVARKVFSPDLASRLVFHAIEGARNPYSWSPDAVRAAVERRRILGKLLPLWFGSRLRLPETYGAGWNEEARTNELVAERVRGRHVPLVGPAGRPDPDPLTDLLEGILRPLQRRLAAAGFEGLLWQAGFGNPVATSNFLLEHEGPGGFRWAWIDLESGVPALFALDPVAQVRFYLPRALRLRRPLFDDVDVPKLRRHLRARAADLDALHGPGAADELLLAADRLDESQRRWRSWNRLERGLLAATASGRLDPETAREYRHHPGGWYARIARDGARRVVRGAATLVVRGVRRALRFPWLGAGLAGLQFLGSQRRRALLGQRLVRSRVAAWQRRGFLDATTARRLRLDARREETSAYATDFAVHLLLKPLAKVVQWGVAPLLLLLGVTSGATTVLLVVTGGAMVRTLYTAGRLFQASARGARRPWVALGVGALPWAGNLAYPMQLAASGVGPGGDLARFVVYDAFAALGRAVPVWGGPDTLTEHLANRLPARILDPLRPSATRPSARAPSSRGRRRSAQEVSR